jgi:type III secretion apparatus needle protein
MAITLDSVAQSLGSKFQTAQTNLETQLKNLDPSKPADMIQMQLAMQKWSMTTQLQSTLTQSIGDTLKGIIQKMG